MHNIEIVCLELVYVSGGNEGLLVVQMGKSQLVKIVHVHGAGRHNETRLIHRSALVGRRCKSNKCSVICWQ